VKAAPFCAKNNDESSVIGSRVTNYFWSSSLRRRSYRGR
jgi:hypothetical protein